MTKHSATSAVWICLCLLSVSIVRADVYQPGDTFVGFSAVNQHGKAAIFKADDARYILFETAGESGETAPPRDPDWFKNHQALLLINVSDLSGLRRRIARSRMESKPFTIWVIDDSAVAARFPQQTGKFTVLRLSAEGKVVDIRYASPGKELQDMLSEGKQP